MGERGGVEDEGGLSGCTGQIGRVLCFLLPLTDELPGVLFLPMLLINCEILKQRNGQDRNVADWKRNRNEPRKKRERKGYREAEVE